MSRYNGQIVIGGILWLEIGEDETTEDGNLKKLLDAVCDQRVGHNWDDDDVEPRNEEELLTYLTDGRLNFTDSQASYGHFADLEQLCSDLNLAYHVRSDAYGEYGACLQTYHPETGFVDFETSAQFYPVTPVQPVREAFEHLKLGQIHQALTLLAEVAKRNPRVPPLPPFEIKRRTTLSCPIDED